MNRPKKLNRQSSRIGIFKQKESETIDCTTTEIEVNECRSSESICRFCPEPPPPKICSYCEGELVKIIALNDCNFPIRWQASADCGKTWLLVPDACQNVLCFKARPKDNGVIYRPILKIFNEKSMSQYGYQEDFSTLEHEGWCPGQGAQILVKKKPKITEPLTDQTVLPGGIAVFQVKAKGCNLRYKWFFNNKPIPGANQNSLVISPVKNSDRGLYEVVVTNECGSVSSSAILDTTCNIVASICGPTAICQVPTFYSAFYCNYFNEVPNPSFNWSISGDATIPFGSSGPSASSVLVSPTEGLTFGHFNLTLFVDDAGCTFSTSLSVDTFIIPTVKIVGPCQTCPNQPTEYQAVVDPIISPLSYDWSLTGGTILNQTENQVTVSMTSAGTLTLYLKGAHCPSKVSYDIGIINSDLKILGPTAICQNPTNYFACLSDPTGFSFNWSVTAGATISGSTLNQVQVLPTTDFNLSLTATNGYCTFSDNLDVKVCPDPVLEIVGPLQVCPNQNVNYVVNVTPSGSYNYLWTVTNGTIIGFDNLDNVTVSFNDTGTLKVKVTLADCPCDASALIGVSTQDDTTLSLFKQGWIPDPCDSDTIAYSILLNNNSRCYSWSGNLQDEILALNDDVTINPQDFVLVSRCLPVAGTTFPLTNVATTTNGLFSNGTTFNISGSTTINYFGIQITENPMDNCINEGATAVFGASATNFNLVSWEVSQDGGTSWTPLVGETAQQLVIQNVSTEFNGNLYKAIFSNEVCQKETGTAAIQIIPIYGFSTSTGGATVENTGVGQGWDFQIVGDPTNAWFVNGVNNTFQSSLTTPPITIYVTKPIQGKLTHLYSFDSNGFNGGNVKISVNNGPFVLVPILNGYDGPIADISNPLYPEEAFSRFQEVLEELTINFGSFNWGDEIRIRFDVGFGNSGATLYNPSWLIFSFSLFC